LRSREVELAAHGARILFVGSGTPAMATDFARAHAGPHPVLSDAGRAVFRAAGMRRGLLPMLRWRFLGNLWRAWRAGFRQGRLAGDPFQQGGVLVFGPGPALRLAQVDQAGGDEIDLAAVLAAVRAG
jgi:hypothetical protein